MPSAAPSAPSQHHPKRTLPQHSAGGRPGSAEQPWRLLGSPLQDAPKVVNVICNCTRYAAVHGEIEHHHTAGCTRLCATSWSYSVICVQDKDGIGLWALTSSHVVNASGNTDPLKDCPVFQRHTSSAHMQERLQQVCCMRRQGSHSTLYWYILSGSGLAISDL